MFGTLSDSFSNGYRKIVICRTVVGNGDRAGTDKKENILGLLELFEGPFFRATYWLCGRMVDPFFESFSEYKPKSLVQEH